MLHEYHIISCYIRNVRYHPWFHVTVVSLGTYYPQIQGSARTNTRNHMTLLDIFNQPTIQYDTI